MVLIGVALALGGCADLGATTTATTTTTTRPSKVAIANRTHEYPAAPPPTATVVGSGAPAAEEAIREFATAYINWTAGTVARDMLVLAAESVGQARSATELAASETAGDYELRRGGVANSGTVQAVAALPGGRGRYVVVTLEADDGREHERIRRPGAGVARHRRDRDRARPRPVGRELMAAGELMRDAVQDHAGGEGRERHRSHQPPLTIGQAVGRHPVDREHEQPHGDRREQNREQFEHAWVFSALDPRTVAIQRDT